MPPLRNSSAVVTAAVSALVLLIAAPQLAAAGCPSKPADSAKALKLAKKWHKKAAAYYDAYRDVQALAAWQCSLSLFKRAETHYNIARAAEGAGRYALAVLHYESYLRKRPTAPQRAEIERKLPKLRVRIPKPPTTPLPSTGKRSRGLRIGGWVAVGLAAALTITSVTLGGLAVRARSKAEDTAQGSWPYLEPNYDTYFGLRSGAWVTAILAGTALATGVVLLLVDRKRTGKKRVNVAPFAGPSGAGLVLGGSF